MFFSIITVTYNAENNIKKTLESLVKQSCQDYEVLLIDGASKDNTLKIASGFKEKLHDMRIVAEPDSGVYDAMNKGVSYAKGKMVYFLNSGDTLYDVDVLEKVKKYIEKDSNNHFDRKIYFGSIVRDGQVVSYPAKFNEWKWIYLERASFSHQALFSTKDLLQDFPFDLSLRVCADRDWLIRSMRSGAEYIKMPNLVVANYEGGGISAGYKNQQKESLILSERYGGRKARCFVELKRAMGKILGHKHLSYINEIKE